MLPLRTLEQFRAPTRLDILDLLSQRLATREPVEEFLVIIDELVNQRIHLFSLENAAGLEDFDDGCLLVLEQLLRGRSEAEINQLCRTEFPMLFRKKTPNEVLAALLGSDLFCRLLEDEIFQHV